MPTGIYKHKSPTKETRKKIAESLKGHPSYQSIERRESNRLAQIGKKLSKEHKVKISNSLIGNKRSAGLYDELNGHWKGGDVKYTGLHKWVVKKLGQPILCEMCNFDEPNKMHHWANISGKYKRDIKDWIRLCVPCHSKFDRRKDGV